MHDFWSMVSDFWSMVSEKMILLELANNKITNYSIKNKGRIPMVVHPHKFVSNLCSGFR